MPDMTKFIIGRDKKPKASLEGLVVTPYFQKFGRNENDGFSIKEIIQSKDFLYRFDPNEFPSIEITGCGEVFFTPIKKVITTTESYFIKWFSLTKEFKIQHDHTYNYARLDKDGYLMKRAVTS